MKPHMMITEQTKHITKSKENSVFYQFDVKMGKEARSVFVTHLP